MLKKWNVKIDGRGLDQYEIIDALFESRGISEPDKFLNPSEDNILPLEDLENIEEAAQTILDAVDNNEVFYVQFDSDTDGATSGSIATRYLRHLGSEVYMGINEGKSHGISKLDLSVLDGINIVWIVDSIETSIEPYKRILNCGVKKIIITDHHLISENLQKELKELGIILVSSAVNDKNEHLSGSCTTWKLCQEIDYLSLDDFSDNLIDLAATGLCGDMCSMKSMENRAICNKAFKNLRNPGIKKINGSYGFVSRNIAFGISPKINAANRTNQNDLAMRIFSTDDEEEIADIVKGLDKCRKDQNEIVDEIMPELKQQAESQIGNKCMFFFLPDNLKASVGGLIGNKMLERWNVPVLILQKVGDEYCGSMRAEGVKSFKEYFDNIGIGWCAGHPNAAGIGIPANRFEEFKEKIFDALKDVEFACETTADIGLNTCQVTDGLIRQLNYISRISGTDFEPISVMCETDDYDIQWMSGGKHLKVVDNESGIIFVQWNYNGPKQFAGRLSAIGTLEAVHYGKNNYKQLTMQTWKIE